MEELRYVGDQRSSSYPAAGRVPSSLSQGNVNEFARLTQAVSANIQKINQNVSQMQRMIMSIGTEMDNPDLRDKLHQIQHYTNQLAKETNQHMKDMSHMPQTGLSHSELRQRRVQKDRLMNEFTSALSNFQTAQRLEKEREKESVDRSRHRAGFVDPFVDDHPADDQLLILNDGQSSSHQRQSLMEEDADAELLQDREQAIRKLEEDITAVNQIFKDLGVLVHEQGDIVDSIEANIESAATNVSQGTEHLRTARNYQSRVRRRKLILILIAVAIVAIIVIIIAVASSR